jgi:F0F1-type ATP synthase assembly protein I
VEEPDSPRKPDKSDENKKGIGSDRDLWRYVSLGTQLTGTVGVFVLLGWWLDQKYGWSPYGVLISGSIGVAAAMYHFVKGALK